MKQRIQLISAYTGYVYMVCLLGGFLIAGFIPPPAPSLGPEAIARFFQENTTGIRIGMFIGAGAAGLLLLWNGALSVQLKRIEGRSSGLVYANVAAGACLVMEFIFPMFWWATAAFRPYGDPEITQRLNDLAWLPFLGVVCTAVIQAVIIGILTLQDKRADPVFPRWFAYFNFWLATTFWAGPMIIFFKDGPLSWNGLISWWMLLTTFAIWLIGVTAMLIRAIKRDDGDLAEDTLGSGGELQTLRGEIAALRTEVAAIKGGLAQPEAATTREM